MHYVIQGEEIYTQDLKIIAKLSQSTSIHRINETAFLLFDAQPSEEIASFCYDRQLDCTWVSEKESLSKFKLAIFDMDSTLIKNECIDEMADAIGIRPTISKITKLAIQGSIPFQESLLSRIEALAGIHEAVLKKIAEKKIDGKL